MAEQPYIYRNRREVLLAQHRIAFFYLALFFRNPPIFLYWLIEMLEKKTFNQLYIPFFHLLPYGIGFGIVIHHLHNLLILTILTCVSAGLAAGIIHQVVKIRTMDINQGVGLGIIFGVGMVLAKGEEHELLLQLSQWLYLSSIFIIVLFRLYYLPLHLFLLLAKNRPLWYRYHPVAWDVCCAVPFPGLARLLVAYHTADPVAGQKEIERLHEYYPSQKENAVSAWVVVYNRQHQKSPT